MSCLQRIPNEDLPLLINLYRKHQVEAPHVFTLMKNCKKWIEKQPSLKFFGINNDWLQSGTFVLIWEYGYNFILLYTLEENYEVLYKAVTQTKTINWNKPTTWSTIAMKHLPVVVDIAKELTPAPLQRDFACVWILEKEKALKFEIEIPEDVFVKSLDKSHIELVNTLWPHKHYDSEVYIATCLEMEASFGIYLKKDNTLVSWVLKNFAGSLSCLQTLSEHKRKGYAVLLTKLISKKIAEDGYDPQAIIIAGNVPSETMFAKLGYYKHSDCGHVSY